MRLLLLAGGAGTRMGGGKAAVDVGGQPLWRWMAERLADEGFDVWVSTGSGFDTGPHEAITDPEPGLGPLGGIAAVAGSDVVVWTVDVPDWTRDELDALARAGTEAVSYLVDDGGRPQPLLARWPASATAAVPAYLAGGGRSVLGLLDELAHRPVGAARPRAHLTGRDDVEAWLRSDP